MSTNDQQAARFGEELGRVLLIRNLSQWDIARPMGLGQSSISAWVSGQRVPTPDQAFELERNLELPPGHLSKHLGYVPVDALNLRQVSAQEAVAGDPSLPPEAKKAIQALIETFSRASPAKAGRPRRGGTDTK